jgi:hypothetical protein
MTDPIVLRNRFAMVKGAWDEHLRGVSFPSLGEGTAEQKIERLEIALVDEMRRRATPESADVGPGARPPGRRPRQAAGDAPSRGSGASRSSPDVKPGHCSTGSRGYFANPSSPASPRSHSENVDPRVLLISRWH